MPFRMPVDWSGPPESRTRIRLRCGATFSSVPITSTWNSSTRLPLNTVRPVPFIPGLISLNGRISWAVAAKPVPSASSDSSKTAAERHIRRMISHRFRATRFAGGARGSHAGGDRDPHQVEGAPHLGGEQGGEDHPSLLPAGIRFLHHWVLVI